MSLHVKTVQVHSDSTVLFADLQVARTVEGVVLRVRLTKLRKRGGEKFLGFAGVNRGGELVRYPEELTESERDAVERALTEEIGPVE